MHGRYSHLTITFPFTNSRRVSLGKSLSQQENKETFNQWFVNGGPPSMTLAQHWDNIGWSLVFAWQTNKTLRQWWFDVVSLSAMLAQHLKQSASWVYWVLYYSKWVPSPNNVANALYNHLPHQVKRRFIPELVHNLASALALRTPSTNNNVGPQSAYCVSWECDVDLRFITSSETSNFGIMH